MSVRVEEKIIIYYYFFDRGLRLQFDFEGSLGCACPIGPHFALPLHEYRVRGRPLRATVSLFLSRVVILTSLLTRYCMCYYREDSCSLWAIE